jgi:hypothetical protein
VIPGQSDFYLFHFLSPSVGCVFVRSPTVAGDSCPGCFDRVKARGPGCCVQIRPISAALDENKHACVCLVESNTFSDFQIFT